MAAFSSTSFSTSAFSVGAFSFDSAQAPDAIRNFSLKNWRNWKREDLEEGKLPEELREEADAAVAEAVNAAAELVAKRVEPENAIAVQMQAREAYEEIFKEAYRDEYVAAVVAENWKEDMRKMRRRRIKTLLLMN